LKKYRSNGEQNIRVQDQHVTINDGGQAIIGSTLQTGVGGYKKIDNQPHEQRARGPAVAQQQRNAHASHAERQQFEAGPCAGTTERAVALRQASVTACIATVGAPRQLWLSAVPSRS
jgi:hypothetical protein